jgi:hypothetical protein
MKNLKTFLEHSHFVGAVQEGLSELFLRHLMRYVFTLLNTP